MGSTVKIIIFLYIPLFNEFSLFKKNIFSDLEIPHKPLCLSRGKTWGQLSKKRTKYDHSLIGFQINLSTYKLDSKRNYIINKKYKFMSFLKFKKKKKNLNCYTVRPLCIKRFELLILPYIPSITQNANSLSLSLSPLAPTFCGFFSSNLFIYLFFFFQISSYLF